MTLDIGGKYYRVGKSQHVKPGKGVAYVQVRTPYAEHNFDLIEMILTQIAPV